MVQLLSAAAGPRGALRGVCVVEAGDLSIAYGGRLLADMGADVVVVERGAARRDDALRVCPGKCAEFYDSGKRVTSAALTDRPDGSSPLAAADVLLLSGTPQGLRRRGLDTASLRARHPRLIVVVVAPFGLSGARAEWRSSNLVAQAVGGMLAVNGWPDAAPLQSLGLQSYHAAGLQAAIGVVLALLRRDREGGGALLEISLQESVVASLEHVTALHHQTRALAERRGTRHWTSTFDVAACSDGAVALSHLGDWSSLVEWLGAEGCGEDLIDECWTDVAYRRAHADQVFAALRRWASGKRVDELVSEAQLRRLPFAPVWPLRRVAAHPQLRARAFFGADASGRKCMPGPPFRVVAREAEHGDAVPGTFPQPVASPSGRAVGAPLAGVRVCDLTWVVAGPVATRLLADFGADVIKIERVDTAADGPRRGGHFGNLNRGKRSIALDLSRPEGVALLRDLVRRCDVVIDNFSPRVLPNWGLDDEALWRLRRDLVIVHMSGFGRSGPCRDWVSYGPTLQAQTGYTAHMRDDTGEAAGWSFSYSDMIAGYSAAFAVLLALWRRRRDGLGSSVDLAQLEVLAAVVGPALHGAARGDEVQLSSVNHSQEDAAAPHGVYRCAGPDRWCAIAVFGESQWRRFAGVVGEPWVDDQRFATLRDRLAAAADLDRRVGEWTARRSAEGVAELLQGAGIAAAAVADGHDLCEADQHLAARGFWQSRRTPEGGNVVLDGSPIRLEGEMSPPRAAGPLLGEHSEEILRDLLELPPRRIAALRRGGIVA